MYRYITPWSVFVLTVVINIIYKIEGIGRALNKKFLHCYC